MAVEAGMRPALALSRLDAMRGKITMFAQSLGKELAAEWPSPVYGKITAVISAHAAAVAD